MARYKIDAPTLADLLSVTRPWPQRPSVAVRGNADGAHDRPNDAS
jgi:hypothetical protein